MRNTEWKQLDETELMNVNGGAVRHLGHFTKTLKKWFSKIFD